MPKKKLVKAEEKKQLQIDSGILQFTPKGAYYESADEQAKQIFAMWKGLFEFDRTLFALVTLLGGTGFSKGAMSHMLLSNPQISDKSLVPAGLSFDYEKKVIKYNLSKERIPRALKNLMMLLGREGFEKVNNSRSRKIIFDFIFDRDVNEIQGLFLNYKSKIKSLLRHAFGKQDLYNILHGNIQSFVNCVGTKYKQYYPFVLYVFGADVSKIMAHKTFIRFPKIEAYYKMKEAAKAGDVVEFQKLMVDMPQRTVMGFRNTYKLPIELKNVYEETKVSDREAIQKEAAAKRSGAKVTVNYNNQDIYDLWKAFYFKLLRGEKENLDKITDAIDKTTTKMDKMDIGECCVIVDASRSMEGSELRPLHPFLTSLCILSVLDNVKEVFYIGGHYIKTEISGKEIAAIIPYNQTDLWRGLVKSIQTGCKNILVISDGYENSIKGMFAHTYNYFKESGYEFNLVHINPVLATDAKSGTSRNLVPEIKALPVSDYKYLETELLFTQMLTNREMVKKLLVTKYQKLLGGKE